MNRKSEIGLTNTCFVYDENRILVQEKVGTRYIVVLYKTNKFDGELKS